MRHGSRRTLSLSLAASSLSGPAALAGLLLVAAPAFAQQAPPAGPGVDPLPTRPVDTARPAPAAPPAADPGLTEAAVKAAEAEAPEDAERAAVCKEHALERLKARSPSVSDIFIDMDGLTIAKAEMLVGTEKITAVLMGEAYIQRDRSDKAHRFLCLVGEGDRVVMTFLTER